MSPRRGWRAAASSLTPFLAAQVLKGSANAFTSPLVLAARSSSPTARWLPLSEARAWLAFAGTGVAAGLVSVPAGRAAVA